MEATTSAVEDSLVEPLDFKIRPGASYITGRRNCSCFSMGGNEYSPRGVRVLRYTLSSDGWLDPSSVRIMYTLVNEDINPIHLLRPLSGPATFFRRLRILCGGAVVEDINDWHQARNGRPSYRVSQRCITKCDDLFPVAGGCTSWTTTCY